MQACGNDFVVIDHLAGIPEGFALPPELVVRLCHRQFGVGCDQLLWLRPSSEFSALVQIFNGDGSVAEMCGNGMRAIGIHLSRRGLSPGKKDYTVRSEAGAESRTVPIDLSGEYPEVGLGVPTLVRYDETIAPFGAFSRVEVGNPHAVFFLSDAALSAVSLSRDGAAIEVSALFPNRTNVEFTSVLDRRKLRVRVWERGAGATLACGSGACAVVAAAEARGLVDPGEKIEVMLPGGSLFVRLESGWREGRGQALLSGPAEDVYTGEWPGV